MGLFATWNELDQRFAFSLVNGEIEIDQEEHQRLIAGQGAGLSITKGADGRPTLIPREQPSEAEAVHERQTTAIARACEATITAGFQSAALGEPHQYSSQLDDQLNLTGAILRGLDMPYACRDEQGVKAFRLHTAAQLRQVGDDFTLYKLQLLQHANELKQQLDLALEAGDAEAMALIRWEAVQP
ncbi:hypothetical protein ACXM96_002247 [Pseudomonas aeruginosa]